MYQNGKKCTKWLQNIANGHRNIHNRHKKIPNCHKYTNIFRSKAVKNGILVRKYTYHLATLTCTYVGVSRHDNRSRTLWPQFRCVAKGCRKVFKKHPGAGLPDFSWYENIPKYCKNMPNGKKLYQIAEK
jgi:hypothetical protein